MKIIYLPLEEHEERYTLQLRKWTEDRFKLRGVDFITIEGNALDHDSSITIGQVLDAFGRPYYATTQIAKLIAHWRHGFITGEDVIFSEDLFQPGYESIPYIKFQLPEKDRPKIYTRCLAQTIDPDDFTFPQRHWMRPFEHMVDQTIDGILIANKVMGWHYRVANLNKAKIYQTGLPFDKDEVRSRVPNRKALRNRRDGTYPNSRLKHVIFSSRFDAEKQPHFFMDLVEYTKQRWGHVRFHIVTSSKTLKSTDQSALDRARILSNKGWLEIHEGLTKNQYYEILADSHLHFNCALQDWQSNTLNEASALGTPSLCPGYRSFPEALNNSYAQLYTPWVIEDAYNKMMSLLSGTMNEHIISHAADDQHMSIDRTIDVLLGNGNQYLYKG